MRLVEVKQEEHYKKWLEHGSSTIMHHDADCCDRARLWFMSMARSMECRAESQYQLKTPVWLFDKYEWGPTPWPISWCELVKEKYIDCGAFSALTREIFKAQGHAVHPAIGLFSFGENCTSHWKEYWNKKLPQKKEGQFFPWIGNKIVYHEVCLLEQPDGSARIFDSTFGIWYEPHKREGHGALLAVRSECPRVLSWGDKSMVCGEWVSL